MRRCFNSAGCRVHLPPVMRGVNAHDDVTGHEGGENELAEAYVTSGHGSGQEFHDHEGFYIRKRSKVFAIMETPQERGQPVRRRAGMSNSRAPETSLR